MRKIILTMALLVGITIAASAQKNAVNEYRVASFNIRMDTPHDSLDAWEHRKDMVNALLKYHELDIIGVQEGFIHQLHDIARVDYLKYVGLGRDDGKEGGEHSAIFYNTHKFDVLDKGDFWFSETPAVPGKGWDAKCCNRICSWVKLKDKKNGKQFFVFNSHFDHEGKVARIESSKLLLKKIKEIAKDAPVIATGDLNSTPDMELIKEIKTTLLDSYDVTKMPPYGPVGTFNGFKWNRPAKNRIDYIFVSKGIEVLTYATLSDAVDMHYPSDHFPIVAKVRIK